MIIESVLRDDMFLPYLSLGAAILKSYNKFTMLVCFKDFDYRYPFCDEYRNLWLI